MVRMVGVSVAQTLLHIVKSVKELIKKRINIELTNLPNFNNGNGENKLNAYRFVERRPKRNQGHKLG